MVVMLDEMKKYLRVDFEDDDVLLRNIMESAQTLCRDVARIEDEDAFEEEPCARVAVMYVAAYLYEHQGRGRPSCIDFITSFVTLWVQTGGVLMKVSLLNEKIMFQKRQALCNPLIHQILQKLKIVYLQT